MKSWVALGFGLAGLLLSGQAAVEGRPGEAAQTSLVIGAAAPDFTLPSTIGKDISLHDYRSKKSVVIAFIVKAFTGG